MNRISDIDKGYKAIIAKMRAAAGDHDLTTGIHSDAGGEVLQYASYNEFGTDRIPERSFIRAWVDENKSKNKQILIRLLSQWLLNKSSQSVVVPLMKAGALFTASVQARIRAGIPPENAASTIARKGSSTPLIDDGILIGSIKSKVDGN